MNTYLAELVGTALLILFGNGVVANMVLAKTKGNSGGWIVITAGWAVGVGLAVMAVGRVSGAHLNPAVTIALATIGDFPWASVPGYIVAQFLGAAIGATFVYLGYLGHWGETSDQGAKLACYCTAPAVRRTGPAFVTEFLGTAVLLFLVLAIGKIGVGLKSDQQVWSSVASVWFGPFLVGMIIFGLGMSLGGPTGYAINPARDFGPRMMHALLPIAGKGSSDWGYAWVPVVAPVAGGFAGAWMFKLLNL